MSILSNRGHLEPAEGRRRRRTKPRVAQLASATPRVGVCLLRYGDTEPAAQDLHGGPASGIEGHVPLSGSQRDLYRAVSAATAAGGGALPQSAAAECESRYRRDHVHRV